jgi:AcrR family transcriptional regulator
VAPAQRRTRRDEILEIAVKLFASRGYYGVSMDDIGAAAGVTGPALYHHFAGKEAMLAAALVALVAFQVDFALAHPAVISLHMHELDRLPEEPRRQIRRVQRLYVEEWVGVLTALRPDLASPAEARVLAHAAFGLMNSTPFAGSEVDVDRQAELLRQATMAALRD